MSDELRENIVVPIYKSKGVVQNYTNYCGIKLRSRTMELWEHYKKFWVTVKAKEFVIVKLQ